MSSSSVTEMKVVQAAWDNHFDAFGKQSVDQILLDYTEDSVISIYDMKSGKQDIYKGLSGVRTCFTNIFAFLKDTSTLEAPVLEVNENPVGSVFLVWKCPSSGIQWATDTFLFQDSKIRVQNVVVWTTADPTETTTAISTEPTGDLVQASWDNHFSAFAEQNVDKILLDYTEESVVSVYDITSGRKDIFHGLQGVKNLFTGLFQDLSDTSELSAPCIQVTEKPGTVFLIWKCPSSGIVSATDTFLFDPQAKIRYQNVVVERKEG